MHEKSSLLIIVVVVIVDVIIAIGQIPPIVRSFYGHLQAKHNLTLRPFRSPDIAVSVLFSVVLSLCHVAESFSFLFMQCFAKNANFNNESFGQQSLAIPSPHQLPLSANTKLFVIIVDVVVIAGDVDVVEATVRVLCPLASVHRCPFCGHCKCQHAASVSDFLFNSPSPPPSSLLSSLHFLVFFLGSSVSGHIQVGQ